VRSSGTAWRWFFSEQPKGLGDSVESAEAAGSVNDNCLAQKGAPLTSLPKSGELGCAEKAAAMPGDAKSENAAAVEAVCHATELATLKRGIASLQMALDALQRGQDVLEQSGALET